MPETTTILDVEALRADFPILQRRIDGHPLVYLDHAASTQKPLAVLDAIRAFDVGQYSNVHRGAHTLSGEATAAFEAARATIADFMGAPGPETIVFTKGTTEAVNLVAQSWGRTNLTAGDVIVVTEMEHHANIVPWQMIAAERGATLRVLPVADDGTLDLTAAAVALDGPVRLLACTHASNTLGTINPVEHLCAMARRRGIVTLVDGAQAIQHCDPDVRAIDCDFYVWSAHKLYGPTGFGVLYGRYPLLEAMPPYQGGGSMIATVSFSGTTYTDAPLRFEAGTPHIEGAIGTAAAIRWFSAIDRSARHRHEQAVLQYLLDRLATVPDVRIFGAAPERVGIVSFVVDGVHAHDIGVLVDTMGVAIRTGHHCTQPLWQRFGVTSTCRASLGITSTEAEVDIFVDALVKACRMARS